MKAFFDAGPSLHGAAIIILQHLDPHGESHLVELLRRHTSLTVRPVQDGLEIKPDHVYVGVPNRDTLVQDGVLRLADTAPERSLRRPIDRLFDSLAAEFGDRTVAVILSGTAADGSHGIASVKTAGGMVIAQDPETAEYDGMPRNAIHTGLVDLILPVEEIPKVLQRLADHVDVVDAAADAGAPEAVPGTLQNILDLFEEQFSYDFSAYKEPTLFRRTHRRMTLCNVDTFDGYASLLRANPEEARNLFRDLMINVSRFFRDPEAWQALERHVIDPLIASRANGDEIRAWSVGCATGEEACTIAMLLIERMEAAGKKLTPQIFASDVSESIEIGRAGIYPATIEADMSPERLERFFVKRDSSYEVKKELRDAIVFAKHNVITDPPFSRMDLVSCRNLLIYVKPEMQQRILAMLNFALRDGGTLLLGNAETIGARTDLFEPISAKLRIFRSRRSTRAERFEFPQVSTPGTRAGLRSSDRIGRPARDEYLAVAQRSLLDRYAPPSVLIDGEKHVLFYHGDTTRYLAQPSGEPTRDLLTLASPGIRPALRQAVDEVLHEKESVVTTGSIREAAEHRRVTVTVDPVPTGRDDAPLLLVSFEEADSRPAPAPPEPSDIDHDRASVEHLEEELRVTRQELSDLTRQYDRLAEEYSTSNEELLSINEELQSANEELETSKEELQSLNEELNTLNNELRSKVELTEQVNNDLNNLLQSTEIATLFLDMNARIRWYTPTMTKVLRVIPSDVGRPIRDLSSRVSGEDIEVDVYRVLENLAPTESEVENKEGQTFLRRVLPYRTSDNRIDGVVVTFVDMTEHKKAEHQRERLMHELSHRIKNTLAAVQAMVHVLARQQTDLPGFLKAFEPRLTALARANTLLSADDDERLELNELLRREFAPYEVDSSERVTVEGGGEGDRLVVGREQAIALQLVFHELVMNAAKYGALSNDVGTISMRWKRVEHENGGESARIEWAESGGPPVKAVNQNWFGSMLIESSVTCDLGGAVDMTFAPEGLRCVIEFPVSTPAGAHFHEREGGADDNGTTSA